MESAVLSSEGTNGLFNSLAGSGNVGSSTGESLPFSEVLRSQQLQTLDTPLATLSATVQTGATEQPLEGAVLLPPQLPSQALPTAWAPVSPQSTRDLLTQQPEIISETDILPVVSWVDPAMTPIESQNIPLPEQSELSIRIVDADMPRVASVEPSSFESLGGGGQPGLLVDSELSTRGTEQPVQAPVISALPGGQAQNTNPSGDIDGIPTNNMQLRVTEQSGADQSPVVSVTESAETAEPDVVAPRVASDASATKADVPAPPLNQRALDTGNAEEIETTLREQPIGRTTVDSQNVADRVVERTSASASAVPSVGPDESVAGDAPSGTQAEFKAVRPESQSADLKPATGDASRPLQQPRESLQTNQAVEQQSATTNATNATAPSASTSVSRSEAMATQVRSAQAPQSRRGEAAERIDTRVATDGSEGYHWLEADASGPVAMESDNPMGQRSQDLMPTANTASAGTTQSAVAARADQTAESFASVRQSVEVAQASTAQQTEGAETTHLEIDTPVRDAQWSQALAYRVQFMAQQGIQRAQIQLNPTELGPMEITVDVVDEVAQVQITAEHAATREALEQATPRLREMMMQNGFAETGIDLSDQRNDSQELASRNPLAGDSGATSSGQSGAGAGESSSDPDKTDIGGGPEVLSGNSSPARTADGRLSFYV